MKEFLVSMIFLLIVSQTKGQTLDVIKYEAYLQKNHTKCQIAIKQLEQNSDLTKTENLQELIHCYYALTSSLIEKKKRDEAEESIKKGKELIETLMIKEPTNALAYNYRAVFTGYEIALNKAKAIIKGRSCINDLNKAYQLAPNNPQIIFDKANSLYYPPKIFGGNKKEALIYIKKAISIYEKQNKTRYNWIYLQLLVLEGHSYELLENDVLAEKSYLKALKTEPNFNLVKNNLYPKLKARMNGTSNEKAKEMDYSLDKKK